MKTAKGGALHSPYCAFVDNFDFIGHRRQDACGTMRGAIFYAEFGWIVLDLRPLSIIHSCPKKADVAHATARLVKSSFGPDPTEIGGRSFFCIEAFATDADDQSVVPPRAG